MYRLIDDAISRRPAAGGGLRGLQQRPVGPAQARSSALRRQLDIPTYCSFCAGRLRLLSAHVKREIISPSKVEGRTRHCTR